MKITVFALILVVLCGGCMSEPAKPPQLIGSPEDYGGYPTNSEKLVNSYIHAFFRDPDSVKDLSFLKPTPFRLSSHSMLGTVYLQMHNHPNDTVVYGYLVGFFCNSKNQFGGYTGIENYQIFIRDGEVVDNFDFGILPRSDGEK